MTIDQGSLAIAWTCQDTVLRFTGHFDAQEYGAMELYFAPDGIWKRGEGDFVGIEGLRAGLRKRPSSMLVRHLLSNMRTTVVSEQEAIVDSYVVAYRHMCRTDASTVPLSSPVLIGRYQDRLTLHEGRWKICFRQVQIDFDGSLAGKRVGRYG